jgi:hypothetical protein
MRVKWPGPEAILDAGFAVAGAGLSAAALWAPGSLIGPAASSQPLLRAVLPLLIGGPLLLRRRAPLLMWVMLWAAISLQALVIHQPPRGPELTLVVSAASYALAAHDSLRRAVAGLAVAVPGVWIYAKASHQGFLGLLTPLGLWRRSSTVGGRR